MSDRIPLRRIFLLIPALLVVVIVSIECISFLFAIASTGKVATPATLYSSHFQTIGTDTSGDCNWGDYVSVHPYLSFFYHKTGQCVRPHTNNFGLVGEDLDTHRKKDSYSILLLGGSVTELLADSYDLQRRHLFESYLNDHYISPNGKPFYIINGSMTAGRQPMEAIAFLLLHDLADAVVSLEGYNEHYLFGTFQRLESPSSIWSDLIELREASIATAFKGLGYKLYRHCAEHWLLSHSYTAFVFSYNIYRALNRWETAKTDSLHPIPDLPPQWKEKETKQYFLKQYEKYWRAIYAVAQANQMKSAFFIQPVPALYKPLTRNDVKAAGDLSYGPEYLEMSKGLLNLKKDGLPVESLLEIFKNYTKDLYVDHIHFNGSGPGNKMLSEALAKRLQPLWGLKEKRQ